MHVHVFHKVVDLKHLQCKNQIVNEFSKMLIKNLFT